MYDIVSNMTTATTREVQRGLSEILDRVERGEEITITRRGKVVARLVPATPPATPKEIVWPDFEARLRALFPDGPLPGPSMCEIVLEGRDR